MSDVKHIAGPWVVTYDSDRGINIETKWQYEYDEQTWDSSRKAFHGTYKRKNTLSLASISCASNKAYTVKRDEAEANAHLIAAAPELLEALEDASEFLNYAWTDIEMDEYSFNLLEDIICKVQQTITKAKGTE